MARRTRLKPGHLKPRHFIREWREYRGLTQERLAERLGLTNGAVSQLENGVVGYTQATLEAVAEALNCDPADLLMRNPNNPGGPGGPGGGMWSIWERASTVQRQQIEALAQTILRLKDAS